MIKLFFLMIFFFAGSYPLKANEVPGSDQAFKSELDHIKNPFEDGIPVPVPVPVPVPAPVSVPVPKPVIINEPKPIYHEEPKTTFFLPKPEPEVLPKPKPEGAWQPEIVLPSLKLQGVMVGEDMHQAIINGQVVPLFGTIEGARVDSVSKEGVELFFKGKKFFLKVD